MKMKRNKAKFVQFPVSVVYNTTYLVLIYFFILESSEFNDPL